MRAFRSAGAAVGLISGVLGAGCIDQPQLTTQQWAAIETREIDAPASRVLPAAALVMLDQGYLFTMSDEAAGLLSAESMRRNPRGTELYARSGGFGAGVQLGDGAVLWVRPLSPTRSEMRLQFRSRGVHMSNERMVTDFWDRTQRRLLSAEPAKGG